MRFIQLEEATLLGRQFQFLAQVTRPNGKKGLVYCPNMKELGSCEILGSRIWLSKTDPLSAQLDVWELTEVNEGWLVNINPQHAKTLVREAVLQSKVDVLKQFHFLRSSKIVSEADIELLWKENGDQCFLRVEPIIKTDLKNEQCFLDDERLAQAALQDLMALHRIGHPVVLLFCVQHSGVKKLSFSEQTDNKYIQLLKEALQMGIQVVAYGTEIDVSHIALSDQIPIALSEDIIQH